MAAQKILMPYNFTAYEEKALDFVINTFSRRKDVKITLFNTYTPLPEINMEASPEMGKMRTGIASLSQELKDKEAGLISAKHHLVENGFSEDQIDYVFAEKKKNIADEIIETVLRGHYRVLVLSRQAGKANRLFARSVHTRILSALKDITICIAT